MKRSITYTVLITKHASGFVATCPALPECTAFGRGRSSAYTAIKKLLRHRITKFIESDKPLPVDPVVSVKHLRINLADIHKELDLR